jgi:hypothetical protein
LTETVLTPAAVASGRFGLLYSLPVDGQIYAQPLYVGGLTVQGRTRNVVYLATAHNTVYAFDADDRSGTPLWSVNLGPSVPQDPENDPTGAAIPGCYNITPEIGIISTPVIDPASQTLFVVAKSRDGSGYHQRIHAIGILDGAIRRSTEIQATVVTGGSSVQFDARLHLNRPGLLLVNGAVYVAFGSHCDVGDYHGWVFGYDAASLSTKGVFVVTPTGTQGAVWQSEHALAADAAGGIYLVSGNGTFTADGQNLSNSIIRLEQRGNGLVPVDFFTPYNTDDLSAQDVDLGSGGPLLIPNTNLLLTGGKEGRLYLADRSQLGGFDPAADHVVQSFQASDVRYTNNIHGTPVYWNSPAGPRLYMWAENEALKAFAFDGARIDTTPVGRSTVLAPWDAMPGGALSLSANGSTPRTGIVWAGIAQLWDATNMAVDGVLRAFDAEDVSIELWNSDRDSSDTLGKFAKFASPTVANGKVYVATFSGAVRVYGLRSETPAGSTPFGGTPASVPGTIQAENFDEGGDHVGYHDNSAGNNGGQYRATDVDIESTGDTGGGMNVGWMAAGEWLRYTIAVTTPGTYTLEARVASDGGGGTFHVEVNGVDATGPLTIPDTGGWQSWQTLSHAGIALGAGQQALTIVLDGNGDTGSVGNLNWLRLTTGSTPFGGTPFGGTPAAIPGTIQAENFDEGGEHIGYHDLSPGNDGGEYRATDVDIEASSDAGGGYDVGWMATGEWLQYTVNVAASGVYTLDARVASDGSGGTFHVEVDGQDATGSLVIPDTGGWQSWRTVTRSGISLDAGRHVLKLVLDSDAGDGSVGNVNYLRFTAAASGGSTPYGGTPIALPGTMLAANFDEGGEGVAYHDTTAGNSGGEYRDTDVDIESTADTGGGVNVGWMKPGEWLQYTANVTVSGVYTLDVRVACPGPGATFHVEVNGVDVTGPMTVPDTGDWQSWQTVSRAAVSLPAGQQKIRLVIDAASASSGRVGNVRYLRIR